MILIQLSPSHSIYMVGHTAVGAWQCHPAPLLSLYGGEGSFPDHVPPNDMVNFESVVVLNLVILVW